MGNSQSASYDVTNVREVKRKEKPDGTVKPLKEQSVMNKNEKGRSENRSPKIEERHETHHEAHPEKSPAQPRKSAAPPPPAEPSNVPIGSGAVPAVPIGSGVVVVDDDIQSLHRTVEPETIPLEAAPSQSRYD
ncbi:unnamed protein product [Cylicocyclus nassatus]|uniref:Uncharacterized protein n=1 Tax=Cylicocyclus nassatus TaxID=53992 RepID=A0AA36HEC7_CYLNA|nr:unnamed protein product [Cylicocyclus nassatus]